MTTTTTTKPAAIASGLPDVGCYFACLASYNNGILHGAWVDLEEATTAEEIQECIDWVLANSSQWPAEEWAMHDSIALPGVLGRTEWPSIEELATYAATVAELNDSDDREAYRLACDDRGQILTEDDFRETYQGCHRSEEDYAQELAEEIAETRDLCSTWPTCCIDWEAAWRQLTYDGYSSEPCSSGGVHIFRSC
jgi:antirestriction protein